MLSSSSAMAKRWCIGLALLAAGCEEGGGEAPAKSRVQAVLAEPGSASAPVEVKPTPEPAAPVKARAPLCAGQLAQKPQAFNPKRLPLTISVAEQELAADPLKKPAARWRWVNFWAAWCVPCKQELPLLLSWQGALARRLEFRFVSLDDDERQLRDFLLQQPASGLTSTYWLPDGATRQSWLEALNYETEPELPLQLLLDPNGMIRCRVQGAVEPEDLAALERIVSG